MNGQQKNVFVYHHFHTSTVIQTTIKQEFSMKLERKQHNKIVILNRFTYVLFKSSNQRLCKVFGSLNSDVKELTSN